MGDKSGWDHRRRGGRAELEAANSVSGLDRNLFSSEADKISEYTEKTALLPEERVCLRHCALHTRELQMVKDGPSICGWHHPRGPWGNSPCAPKQGQLEVVPSETLSDLRTISE